MEFIDHTGHIFSQQGYDNKPIGYEWIENKYVFWINSEYGYKLSTNNYYFKPIRILVPIDSREDNVTVNISVDENSQFHLIGSKQIQTLLSKNSSFVETVEINESDFVQQLTNDDLCIVNSIKDELYKCYYTTYYVYYTENGKMLRYNNDKVIIRDGKKYGENKFGPVTVEVELFTNYTSNVINDESSIITIDVPVAFYKDVTYIDNGQSVIFNQIENCSPISITTYNNLLDAFVLNRSKLDGDDLLKDTLTFSYIENNGINYPVEPIYRRYALVPFYAVIYAAEEGSWTTNVLINVKNEYCEYCAITIGAEIVDECEELIINGQNMGVKLPKQILQAIYSNPYFIEHPDERLYAQKIKEYLMNFMSIRGQQGNLRSAINSLKWFGWGDYVTINKLLKTDNQLQCQYIRDTFDIINDTLYSYETFRNSTMISLSLRVNGELNETYQEFINEFWGEGKPQVENYFDKMIVRHYDEQDIDFYRGYFDYTFNELGLKLCALKYYYKQYFLPIHLNMVSTSMEHQCFVNDIKLISRPSSMITEPAVLTNTSGHNNKFNIVLPNVDFQYLLNQVHYIDDCYCEYNDSYIKGSVYNEDIYYINDTVVNIPIQFIQEDDEMYYNCKLILKKDDVIVHECAFQFTQKMSDYKTYFKNFVIHPKTINTKLTGENTELYDANFWLDSTYTLYLCVNDCWYTYSFIMKLPELNIKLGRLEYKYYLDSYDEYEYKYGKQNLFKQINGFGVNKSGRTFIKFNSFMFQPDLVSVNNTNFINEVLKYSKENNVNYVDGSNVEPGSFYYYIEYDNIRYIFNNDNIITNPSGTNIYTVANTEDIKITVTDDGKYNLTLYSLRLKNEDTVITNLDLHTTLFNNMDTYIKQYYTISNNFIDNKYLNICHLIDLYDENGEMIKYTFENENEIEAVNMNGEKFTFGDNSSMNTINLYKQFFDKNGDSCLDNRILYNGKYVKPCMINGLEYDLYLMHDDKQWYIMLISRKTLNNATTSATEFSFDFDFNVLTISVDDNGTYQYNVTKDDTISNKYFLKIVNKIYNKQYYLKYNRSDNKVLINRLQYVPTNGINHFDTGDIIACTLINNEKLPFKLGLGSKWVFTPMSLGMNNSVYVSSPNEMGIVSIGNSNTKYDTGYYNITCNYSLDDFTQHGYEKTAKMRINK